MQKLLIALILGVFLIPSTSAVADFEDTRRERDEKIIEKNHNNPSLKPKDTSKVLTGTAPGNPSKVQSTNNDDNKPNNSSEFNTTESDGRK